MKLPSPALTALDLVRYPRSGTGLDNIATVLSELTERMQPKKPASLLALSRRRSCSASRIYSEGWSTPFLGAG